MGLRSMLERSASAMLQRRPQSTEHDDDDDSSTAVSARNNHALQRAQSATADVHGEDAATDTDDDERAVASPVHMASNRVKPTATIAGRAARLSATARATAAARISRLVGENPPMGSSARVVRRQYQSVVKEREHEYDDDDKDMIDAVAQYEVEFPKQVSGGASGEGGGDADYPLGIELETDFYGKHTVVKHVKRSSVAYALTKTGSFLKPGHIVVAVNGRDLSKLSFLQVLAELRVASAPRVIRFLDPSVLSINDLKVEPTLVNQDQYGFAKDDKYILNYRRQLRKRKLASYEHEKRWAQFVQHQGGIDAIDRLVHNPSTDPYIQLQLGNLLAEMRTLVLKGIPAVLRPRVWSVLTGVSPYRAQYPAEYYHALVAQIETSPSIGDIEKDIHRTYPEHAFFQSDKGRRELQHVLGAYSLHNPSIGYCQSMNFIAGMLLLFTSEEDAFWLFCAIMEPRYLPSANYTQSMVGTQTDQLVFKQLVQQELPVLAARLELCGIQIQLNTLHWFLCAFVCTLPTESALRIWDWFFLDGQEVLFITAIGILKHAEPQILAATTHSDLHTIIRELGTDLHDDDAFMAFLYAMAPPSDVERSAALLSSISKSGFDTDDEEEEEEEEEDEDTDELDASLSMENHGRRKRLAANQAIKRVPTRLHSMLRQFVDSRRKDVHHELRGYGDKSVRLMQKQFTMLEIAELRAQFRPQFEKPSSPPPPPSPPSAAPSAAPPPSTE